MNQAFIVRPFGTKNGIDFDWVEAELIQPAIKAVGFAGGTTGKVIRAGNIRTDMFQKLLGWTSGWPTYGASPGTGRN